MKPYNPKPIDTSKIKISEDLLELKEKLAENAHDNWAVLRIEQGWKWGVNRDDERKTHPDLVPYSDLSEADKDFDRKTAMETIKAIIALGYMIQNSHIN